MKCDIKSVATSIVAAAICGFAVTNLVRQLDLSSKSYFIMVTLYPTGFNVDRDGIEITYESHTTTPDANATIQYVATANRPSR